MSRPASNSAKQHGSSWIRRAIVARFPARRDDIAAFHDTQCSTDRMPVPPHPSVSISIRIVRTGRATAALIVPMTATVSRSAWAQACSCGETIIVMPRG